MHRKQAQTGGAEGELGGERKKRRAGGNTRACKVSAGRRLLRREPGRHPAPPPSMNRPYVPESVLPVTSALLNNEAAPGVSQNCVHCVSVRACGPFLYAHLFHCCQDIIFMSRFCKLTPVHLLARGLVITSVGRGAPRPHS